MTTTNGFDASIFWNIPPELVCIASPAVAAYVYTAVVALVNIGIEVSQTNANTVTPTETGTTQAAQPNLPIKIKATAATTAPMTPD